MRWNFESSNIGREFLLIFFSFFFLVNGKEPLPQISILRGKVYSLVLNVLIRFLLFKWDIYHSRRNILDHFILFFIQSHSFFPRSLNPLDQSQSYPTNLIIITREERMPGRGIEFLVTGVYQLSDEEWRYRSYYRPRKLPLRYAGSFVNVDRKITGQVRRKGGQVIGPFPAGGSSCSGGSVQPPSTRSKSSTHQRINTFNLVSRPNHVLSLPLASPSPPLPAFPASRLFFPSLRNPARLLNNRWSEHGLFPLK